MSIADRFQTMAVDRTHTLTLDGPAGSSSRHVTNSSHSGPSREGLGGQAGAPPNHNRSSTRPLPARHYRRRVLARRTLGRGTHGWPVANR